MKSDELTPVMAHNPYSDRVMNVEPLFRFLEEEAEGKECIDDVIKHIVVNRHDDMFYLFDEFRNEEEMFIFLYKLKQLFDELSQCNIALPKKKGGQNE